MKMIQKAIPLLLLWAVCVGTAQAISVSVTPSGVLSHTLPSNVTNAGDYYGNAQTITTQSSLSITGVAQSGVTGWKLYASLEQSPTDPDITVRIQRTDSVSGINCTGGSITLSTAEGSAICTYTGTGDITGITFQYQVDGVGTSSNLIRVANGTHTWKVKYRVEEIPTL